MEYRFHAHDLVSAPSGSGKLLPARILKLEGNELVVEFIAKQLRKVKVRRPRARARATREWLGAKAGAHRRAWHRLCTPSFPRTRARTYAQAAGRKWT